MTVNLEEVFDGLGMEESEIIEQVDQLARRRGLYIQTGEPYGGTAGFYTYGPNGSPIKSNIENVWREKYVISEGNMEIESPSVMEEAVFEASGHLEDFDDWLIECDSCGESNRADHIVEGSVPGIEEAESMPNNAEEFLERLDDDDDSMTIEDVEADQHLEGLIEKHNLVCPDCGALLAGQEVTSNNLMFQTQIGPNDGENGYLRPETAQGMFADFPRWANYAREELPFGITQIGPAYRNEISPRGALIRLRQLHQAELEYFVDPEEDKPDLDGLRDIELTLYPQPAQDGENTNELELTLEQALDENLYEDHPDFEVKDDVAIYKDDAEFYLPNEDPGKPSHFPVIGDPWIGYFLAISKSWYDKIGIDMDRFRYRQHQNDELAHYASDCWDAEAYANSKWVEITGFAYRGCFDLESHEEHDENQEEYTIFKRYDEPKTEEVGVVDIDMSTYGPKYGDDAEKIKKTLETEAEESPEKFENQSEIEIEIDDEYYSFETEELNFRYEEKEIHGYDIYPHVIEPSFGVDRVVYTVIEHAYRKEGEGEDSREYLSLPPAIAPTTAGVFPLKDADEYVEKAKDIVSALREEGIDTEYDDSGSIGRRYYRQDEKGTPFCITVDDESLDSETVTIRERDSTDQKRVAISNLSDIVYKLMTSEMDFADI